MARLGNWTNITNNSVLIFGGKGEGNPDVVGGGEEVGKLLKITGIFFNG